jgi:hypothetical protein
MKKDKLLTYKTKSLVKNFRRIYPELEQDVEFAGSETIFPVNILRSLRPKQNALKRMFRRFSFALNFFLSGLLMTSFKRKRNHIPYV